MAQEGIAEAGIRQVTTKTAPHEAVARPAIINPDLLNGLSGGSRRVDADTRPLLEKLSQLSRNETGEILRKSSAEIRKVYHADAKKKWGKTEDAADFQAKMVEWSAGMDRWWQGLGPVRQQQAGEIFAALGVKPGEGHNYSWDQLHGALLDKGEPQLSKLIDAVRGIPDVKGKLGVIKEIAGIFGENVQAELFKPVTPFEKKEDEIRQSHETADRGIERQIERARQETPAGDDRERRLQQLEAKRKKWHEHIDARATDFSRIFNEITWDPGITPEQRTAIEASLRKLPPDMVRGLGRICVKDMKVGIAGVKNEGNAHSFTKIADKNILQIRPDFFNQPTAEMDKILNHEVGGHVMRYMLQNMAPGQLRELAGLWKKLAADHPQLVYKDTYARKYYEDPGTFDNRERYFGVDGALDEFMSDRMAEFFSRMQNPDGLANDLVTKRDSDNPFTDGEQRAVDELCQRTYEVWKAAVSGQKSAIRGKDTAVAERGTPPPAQAKESAPDTTQQIADKLSQNGFYEGNIPDGILPRLLPKDYIGAPIEIDRKNDPVLFQMLGEARELQNLPPAERYLQLLKLVDRYTTDFLDDGDSSTWQKVKRQEMLIGERRGDKPIRLGEYTNIGEMGGATCWARALFVQILGREIGLNPILRKGVSENPHHIEGADDQGGHLWNEAGNEWQTGGKPVILETYRQSRRIDSTPAGYAAKHTPAESGNIRLRYYDTKGKLLYSV